MNTNYEEREDGIYKKDNSVQKGNADFFFFTSYSAGSIWKRTVERWPHRHEALAERTRGETCTH